MLGLQKKIITNEGKKNNSYIKKKNHRLVEKDNDSKKKDNDKKKEKSILLKTLVEETQNKGNVNTTPLKSIKFTILCKLKPSFSKLGNQ